MIEAKNANLMFRRFAWTFTVEMDVYSQSLGETSRIYVKAPCPQSPICRTR